MKPRALLLLPFLAAFVCASDTQTNNSANDNNRQRSIWDEPVRFSTKSKDSCTMVVSGAGDYTRLRVSCKGPSQGQTAGRSYYCDFRGKPNLCRAYSLNPRHYFTQMMWELRKLSHACQGAKIYRPPMCKKHPEDVQMTFLSAWPRTAISKPSKPVEEPLRKPAAPAQSKPATTQKPLRPQPVKPHPGKVPQTRRTTPKPAKTSARPTELPESKASRMASEYCWKSFQGICSYVLGWFHN
ncbi:fibroblast growth factor-binding protein 2b [Dunckerocampus dactyliophorus]|uniref:fibroblast growth factor-binding protein 2b n=1 Tax=Dunckerocampus dactyliophorus TaxID=161453 RepID=UPI002405A17B|nr:fibroblast growth factor-binding protein 2b [Dunckerocampus dactyliophorus]